jgi:myo-inositol catabolism protein IolC
MDKPLDLIVVKKDSLALVECRGTLGAETLDSLGQNRWWIDMKMQWRNTKDMRTKVSTEVGLLELAVEKIRVRVVVPLWHLIQRHPQNEALMQLNKQSESEETLRLLSQ